MSAVVESVPASDVDRNEYPLEVNTYVDGLPGDAYRYSRGLSKTGLDNINQSPAHYLERKLHPRPSTDAQRGGIALHCCVLEPDKFEARYIMRPSGIDRRTKAGKAAWLELEQAADGRGILDASEWDTLHRMRDAILENRYAAALLSNGHPERSFWWIDGYAKKLCKGRADWCSDEYRTVIDLKRAADASYTGFAKACANHRYHVQDAYFTDGLRACGMRVDHFVFLAVEPEPPYGVGLYELDREEKEQGRLEYERNLYIYATCHDADEWPGYPPEVRTLQMPRWGFRAHAS